MKLIKHGVSRWVFLIGSVAIKFPSLSSWRQFLLGLLANMREAEWSCCDDRFCPIVFKITGGFAVVMKRAETLTDIEFDGFDYDRFVCDPTRELNIVNLVERKSDSFGRLKNGKIVAVDYGN